MAIDLRGAGSLATCDGGDLVPGLPSGVAEGDILVLGITARDNVAISLPAGWTIEVADNLSATFRATVAWKVAGASESDPTVTHTGGSTTCARIMAFTGCTTTPTPIHKIGINKSTLSVPTVTGGNLTPDLIGCALVNIAHHNTNTCSAWEPSGDRTSFVEVFDDAHSATRNTALAAAWSLYAGLAATGTTMCTLATSSPCTGTRLFLAPTVEAVDRQSTNELGANSLPAVVAPSDRASAPASTSADLALASGGISVAASRESSGAGGTSGAGGSGIAVAMSSAVDGLASVAGGSGIAEARQSSGASGVGVIGGTATASGREHAADTLALAASGYAIAFARTSAADTLGVTAAGWTLQGYRDSVDLLAATIEEGIYLVMSNAIRTFFSTTVEPALGIPVQYDNHELAHPDATPWARIAIVYQPSDQIELGPDPTFRKPGTATVSILVPIAYGTDVALAHADTVADAFRGSTVSGIRFQAPTVVRVGRVKDTSAQVVGGRSWWQVDVVCPFRADDTVVALVPTAGTSDGFSDVADTIRTRFESLVTGPESLGGRVQYENAEIEPPSTGLWVSVHVLHGSSGAVDMASAPVYESAGVVIAQIFAPLAEGDRDALALGDAIVAAFRAVTDKCVTFGSPTVVPIGRGSKWWQVNVQVPFSAQRVA